MSEQRFRTALAAATGDDALILQTQIARTFGLRGDFAHAQQILDGIEPQVESAGGEVRARHALERGRTLSSATHPPESQTEPVKSAARAAYLRALDIAQAERLDDLAIDALHMLAFVDTDPADQLAWGLQALAVLEGSSQPAARRWEGSLRNNVGYALHQQGRYAEALAQFELALAFRSALETPSRSAWPRGWWRGRCVHWAGWTKRWLCNCAWSASARPPAHPIRTSSRNLSSCTAHAMTQRARKRMPSVARLP